jgi:Kef-type K+ transport system membrane component KefB
MASLVAASFIWYTSGRIASRLGLPLITGYISAGILTGPFVSNLLSKDTLLGLIPLEQACLSLIALAAGAELQTSELKRIKSQVIALTLSISICSWLVVWVAAIQLIPLLGSLERSLSASSTLTFASLIATLSIARSPASAIAVIKEVGARGPFTSLVMSVVVAKDVLVFIAFALNMEVARALQHTQEGGESSFGLFTVLKQLLISVTCSAILGMSAGCVLCIILEQPWIGNTTNSNSSKYNSKKLIISLLCLFISVSTFFMAEVLHIEPLLACVTMGVITANYGTDDPDAKAAAAMGISTLMPYLNTIFFGLVGASIKIESVGSFLWAAAWIYTARLVGIWVGCWSGGWMSGTAPRVLRQRLWQGMVTQAGIALGLGKIVASRFGDSWGGDFGALAAGVVVANLLTGPPLFRAAIVSLGENTGTTDGGGDLPLSRSDASLYDGNNNDNGQHSGRRSGGQVKLIPVINEVLL